MQVILLKEVESLGPKGTVANVSPGYARNFLFPRNLAQEATPGRVAAIQKAIQEKEARERREAEQAEETREILQRTVLTIAAPAGQGERIFGSITTQDVVQAIYTARKIRVDKRKVVMDEAIKTVGPHMIKVDVHHSVEPADVKIIVVPEGGKS